MCTRERAWVCALLCDYNIRKIMQLVLDEIINLTVKLPIMNINQNLKMNISTGD